MYFHHVVGTGSYTTSTTNMYHKDRFHVHCVASVVEVVVGVVGDGLLPPPPNNVASGFKILQRCDVKSVKRKERKVGMAYTVSTPEVR